MNLAALPLADRAEYLADRDMHTLVLDIDEADELPEQCPTCLRDWDAHGWVEIVAASGEVIDCDGAGEVTVAGTAAMAVAVTLAA